MNANKRRKIILAVMNILTAESDESELVVNYFTIPILHVMLIYFRLISAFKTKYPTNKLYRKDTILTTADGILRNAAFHIHFRMSRDTFEKLLLVVGQEIGDIQLRNPLYIQLLMTLWILATPDSFRSVGENFSSSASTVHDAYIYIINILYKISGRYITWPSPETLSNMQTIIKRKCGFPGVAGFIDGTHINIKAPVDPVRYFNRKKQTSLILQGTCNMQLMFMDVYFGEVGSLHDSRVYTRSPLSRLINEKPQMLGNNGHLLGDSAYKLTLQMLTPYRDNGHLLDEQIHYNYVHSNLRCAIERAFGLLKGKWRRLKYLDANVFHYMRNHVIAVCTLHNFIIFQKDEFAYTTMDTEEPNSISRILEIRDFTNDNSTAVNKRDQIAAILYERDLCR